MNLRPFPRRGPVWACSGQALTESLVALLFLVPLWVAAFHLWVWQDLQHVAIAAARYALFDAVSDPAPAENNALQQRTRMRVLSDDGERFTRGRFGGASRVAPRDDWRGLDSRTPLLDSLDSLQVSVVPASQPESAEQAERAAFAMLPPALAVGVGPFDLRRAAALKSRVQVSLQSPMLRGVGFDDRPITLAESLYAMFDPWVAETRGEVAARTRSLSAVGLIAEATSVLTPVKDAVELLEPSFRGFCPGRIDPDLVPDDRLSGGRLQLNDLRVRPC